MKQTATNEFKDGMNLDLHPIVTPNTVLTDNINGTFITYNGNEFCLQNDRGNKYVTSLTPGYTPIGIKEHNGILYIVSVNENKTEIGTFPSLKEPTSLLDNDFYKEYGFEDNYKALRIGEGHSKFTGVNLGYTIETPITIEIQDSYDGTVNLILVADGIHTKIINSGFSKKSETIGEWIKRNQTVDTNVYHLTDNDVLNQELNLIRTSTQLTNIDLIEVQSGGQFKGGNYTFYIKFGDADYNQTDVVAESGIVSIFNGNDGVPSTISGTLLDERTDKMIHLAIVGLNHVYSKIYIYYSREYSDTQGFRMTEYGMFNEPIDMVNREMEERFPIGSHVDPASGAIITDMIGGQKIWLTGFEQTVPIDPEVLNIDYHTVDWARAEAQHSNMLFLGNVGNEETFSLYRRLDEFTKGYVTTTIKELPSNVISSVAPNYKSGDEYYSTHNIYNYLGYWPNEIYRFGVVYILQDGSTTPVFNMNGGTFLYNENNEFWTLNQNSDVYNKYGVFLTPKADVFKVENDKQVICPLHFTFSIPNLPEKVIGWFIVRQKRIPMTICQGLSVGIEKKSHLPVIYNGESWDIESFLSYDREAKSLNEIADNIEKLKDDKNNWWKYAISFFTFLPLANTIGIYGLIKSAVANNKLGELLGKYMNAPLLTYLNRSNITWIPSEAYLAVRTSGYTEEETWRAMEDGGLEAAIQGYDAFDTSRYDQIHDGTTMIYSCEYSIRKYVYNKTEKTWSQDGSVQRALYFNDNTTVFPTNLNLTNVEDRTIHFSADAVEADDTEDFIIYLEQLYASKEITNAEWRKRVISLPNEQLAGRGLLSLDPCVNSGIASMLDGSEFIVEQAYQNILDLESGGNRMYAHINNQKIPDINHTRQCVYIPQDTNVKVIDNFAFSNIAGNAASVKQYKELEDPFNVIKRGDESYIPVSDDSEYADNVGNINNINIVRGSYCPYVGVVSNELEPLRIYSIRLKGSSLQNLFKVREQDNSEYYCVSDRVADLTIDAYRGDCYTNTVTIRINKNFIDNTAPAVEQIVDEKTWAKWALLTKEDFEEALKEKSVDEAIWDQVNLSDVNTVDLGMWVTFKCLSSYNLGLRSLDTFHTDEMALLGSPRSFYPLNGASTATGTKVGDSYLLNDGLSATVGRKRYNLMPDVPYSKSEFANRIMFSNVNVTDAFTNGYRTFQGLSYKDYDKQYGAITKLISLGQNIFVVMEHGLGLVPVNPKALMQTTTGEAIHIYGYGVLPDEMTIISQDYGSKYEHSVIRTPIGIYGVDVDAKKVWRYSDKQGFQTISDMKIETYLKDYLAKIDVQMGLKDIRTHYNAKKGDVMFTFYTIDPSQREAFIKKYFYIDKSQITVLLNKQTSIKCSTNMDDSEIEITYSDNLNCTYKNGIIELIGIGLGIGKIYVNGEQKLEIIVKEQQDVPETTDNIEISKQTLLMQVEQSYQLSAITNVSNPQFVWTSSDNSVVRIDSSGRITAITIGRALISVTVEGSSVSASCIVTVQIDPIRVTDVSLNKTKVYVEPNGTFILNPIITPDNATNKLVTWNVNGNILTTSDPNTFKATSIGSGSVTVTTNDGGYTSTADVIISDNIPVSKIEITPRTMLLYQGQQGQFNANVYPESASNKTVKWSVSQDSKISVDQSGCVTAINVGSSNVIAKSEDENVQATALVTVLQNPSSKIVLSKKSLSIKVGETGSVSSTLYCKIDDWVSNVFPNVNYEIANKSIAKITSNRDQEVFIEGISRGVTTIKFTAKDDPSITASCEIIVTEGKLTLSTTYENMFPNETKKITIIEKEGNLHISQNNNNVSYEYENNAIYLTGNTIGTTIFTISDGITTVELEAETREIIPLNGLILAKEIPEVITLHVGEVFSLGYKYDPEDYTKEKYMVPFGIDNGDIIRGSRGDRPQYIWDPDLWGDSDMLTSWTALRPGTTTGHIEIWGGETEFRKIKDYVLNFEVIE